MHPKHIVYLPIASKNDVAKNVPKSPRSVMNNQLCAVAAHSNRQGDGCFIVLVRVVVIRRSYRSLYRTSIRGRQRGALTARTETVTRLIFEDEFLDGDNLLAITESLQLHQLRPDLIDQRLTLLPCELA